jgi:hypothetical protein
MVASAACAQTEHGVLIEARTQGDVESIQVSVVDLSGGRPPARSSLRPIRRTADQINRGEPIRIAVGLPGPMDVLVHIVATGNLSGNREVHYVATRCYPVQGLIRDTVLLVGPIGPDLDEDGDAFPRDPGATCRDPGPDASPVPCDFACTAAQGGDCNDRNSQIFPGAPELCRDDIDQDCDGQDIDCEDRDGDGWRTCSPDDPRLTCDCEDNVAEVNPAAAEVCRDGIDQDCDGTDGRCDQDGDGFVADRDVGGAPDCDDTDPDIHPGAREICTPRDDPMAVARDEDCNGFIDDAPECTDDDLDRDGSPACPPVSGPCTRRDCDCNDCDAGIHPRAREICGNRVDENQDGTDDCPPGDGDRDGYPSELVGGSDCDDGDSSIYPGAPDRCGDMVAQNCIADSACTRDQDDDGYNDGAGDCDDGNPAISPAAMEMCNTVDDDCDGVTNEVGGRPETIGTTTFPYGSRGCVVGDARLGEGCAGLGVCEVDFRTSVVHCGGCRVACNPPDGNIVADVCVDGVCDCGSEPGTRPCDSGWTCCAGSGCHNLQTDFEHCGFCHNACTRAADRCASGTCVCGELGRTCDPTRDGSATTCCGGLCVDTQTNPEHCGGCGIRCGPHASCVDGRCRCNSNRGNCNASDPGFGYDDDGCETDLLTSLAHCGACRATCRRDNATATCATGTCQIAMCNAGYANCDGNDANGCEQPLTTLSHCGACGVMCSRANATATCSTGTCQIAMCNAGYANCDMNDANGCEQPLTTLSHCGACGVMCSRANATATCSTGTCQIAMCNAGYANCDMNDANGCEVDTRTDPMHCGMCGQRCGANMSCSSGRCVCNPGFGDCDGNPANGCETNLSMSSMHCGMCGRSCGANATCSSGSCMCNEGYADCDRNPANGCETNLSMSSMHCGMCGRSCGANATCSTGSCMCNPGFADCDMNDANGCEVNTRTDPTNCGMCGTTCPSGQTCTAGRCG